MLIRPIDTHEEIKNFINAGFTEKQAEQVVNVIKKSHDYDFSNLVTTDYFKINLEKALLQVKVDIIKWMIGLNMANLGIIFTIIKFGG